MNDFLPKQTKLIQNSYLSLAVNPLFGAIHNIWDDKNKPLLWQPDYNANAVSPVGGCFPLIPYANRIKNAKFSLNDRLFNIDYQNCESKHALHGDGWINQWQVISQQESSITLGYNSHFFPFHYRATQVIELLKNAVCITLNIQHLGRNAMPYGMGFHPWFIKQKNTRLHAPAKNMYEEDKEHFPTKLVSIPAKLNFSNTNSVLPDGFANNLFIGWAQNQHGQSLAKIYYPNSNRVIGIEASNIFDRYMYYQDGNDFFCFEPVSHNINAHNQPNMPGLALLSYQQGITGKFKMVFE